MKDLLEEKKVLFRLLAEVLDNETLHYNRQQLIIDSIMDSLSEVKEEIQELRIKEETEEQFKNYSI